MENPRPHVVVIGGRRNGKSWLRNALRQAADARIITLSEVPHTKVVSGINHDFVVVDEFKTGDQK